MKEIKIILSSIFIFFLLLISFLPSLKTIDNKTIYGPFHHSARVYQPTEICQFDNKIFCCVENNLYELVNDTFVLKTIYNEKQIPIKNIKSIKSYEDKIIISSDKNMYLFNINFVLLDKLNIQSNSMFLIDNNYIYYIPSHLKGKLFKYDMSSKTEILLSDSIINNTCFDNQKLIYCNDSSNLYFINEENNNFFSNKNLHFLGNNKRGFYSKNNIGLITSDDNKIIIRFDNIEYILQNDNSIELYEYVYSYNNNVFFTTYEYINNDNCNDEFCICHYGKTTMWCFNLDSKEFSEIFTLSQGSYLVSFNCIDNSFSYYSNGHLYMNSKIINVPLIKPYGEYSQVLEKGFIYHSISSYSIFYEYDNSIYHYFLDRKDIIKDNY